MALAPAMRAQYIYFMELDTSVVLRLLVALRECTRHLQRGVAEHPLSEVDVGLLALADAYGGALRPSQAAEALDVRFPSVTRHVRALQGAGHLSVDPDPDDGRSYRIVLTGPGKVLLASFRDDLVARFAPVVAGWEPGDLATLADGLARLAGDMTAARRAAAPSPARPAWWRTGAPGKGDEQ